MLDTFWLNLSASKANNSSSRTSNQYGTHHGPHTNGLGKDVTEANDRNLKADRLVEWMVDILLDHIQKIVSWVFEQGKRFDFFVRDFPKDR